MAPTAARDALSATVASGGVAVFPADGLYGLACDPLRADAIARVHALKGRDDGKPSAVLFFSPLILRELISSFGDPTRARARRPAARTGHASWRTTRSAAIPSPAARIPSGSGSGSSRARSRGVATPLFQTSANLAGEPAPSRFEDVPAEIVEGADLAIDGGELTGLPSTVVDVTGLEQGGGWKILREGGMPEAEVDAAPAPRAVSPASGALERSVAKSIRTIMSSRFSVDDHHDALASSRFRSSRPRRASPSRRRTCPGRVSWMSFASSVTVSITSRNDVHQRRKPSTPS